MVIVQAMGGIEADRFVQTQLALGGGGVQGLLRAVANGRVLAEAAVVEVALDGVADLIGEGVEALDAQDRGRVAAEDLAVAAHGALQDGGAQADRHGEQRRHHDEWQQRFLEQPEPVQHSHLERLDQARPPTPLGVRPQNPDIKAQRSAR